VYIFDVPDLLFQTSFNVGVTQRLYYKYRLHWYQWDFTELWYYLKHTG